MPDTPPRWFWLLPLLAIGAWWPVDPYWQSDDFLALHYASDLSRALADFTGPQYGATDVWWFWRPLITLSFWFDQTVAGAFPPWSHVGNVLAHGVTALLLARLLRRWLPDGAAFVGALVWALMPSHLGSLAWAVGRVDSYTAPWCLLALLAAVHRAERTVAGERSPAWPMLAFAAAALASKELAVVVPPLATALVVLLPAGESGVAARARRAFSTTWPLWMLLAGYVAFRFVVLGRFGGYGAATYEPAAMLAGLATIVHHVLVPLEWSAAPDVGAVPAAVWRAAATVPVVACVLLALRHRPRLLLAGVALFLLATLPMAGFFAAADNPHTLRYQYLPGMALAAVLAAAGRLPALCVLLAWSWPLFSLRSEQHAADVESGRIHAALLREAEHGAESPMFVQGLPHQNARGTTVQLHFGVDRMLAEPFRREPVRLFALRPLAELPHVVRLGSDDEPPFALPLGSTWWLPDASALGKAPSPPPLPELVLRGDEHGVLDLTTTRLEPLIELAKTAFRDGTPSYGLTAVGVRPQVFRVTIFTANGYLACLCRDHAADGPDGAIDVLRFLAGDPVRGFEAARFTLIGERFVGDALVLPSTIDLVPEFPTLVEAGAMTGSDLATAAFVPSHRARRLVTLRLDRGYPGWVRRAQGAP